MAESWRSRANRYSRGDFNKNELLTIIGLQLADKAMDIATYGQVSKLQGKALARVVAPLLTKAIPSIARTGFGASRLLMSNPYVAVPTAIYVGYQERERIKQLLDQGYEIVEERVPPILEEAARLTEGMGGLRPAPLPKFLEEFRPKPRKASSFNKAVSAGMKAVKTSTSYGGKGVIKPAKKAFSVVVKLAAAKKKKKKAPKSGLRRRIWNAMKGLR